MKRVVVPLLLLLVVLGAAHGILHLSDQEEGGAKKGKIDSLAADLGGSGSTELLAADALHLTDAQERIVRPALREHWSAARKAINAASGTEAERSEAVRNAVVSNMARLQLKIRDHVSPEELVRICNAYLKQLSRLRQGASPAPEPPPGEVK